MRTDTDSPISILRFIAGLAVSPLLTVSLVLTPSLILNAENWLLYIAFHFALLASYIVSLFIGLPIILFLDAKQKCTFKNLAISGFILGFTTFFAFGATIGPSNTAYSYSLAQIINAIMDASWFGISAAAGATLFAMISGITYRYNNALNSDTAKDAAPVS